MKKLLVAFFVLLYNSAHSQIGLYNQYHFNYLALNPALAGENGPFTVKGVMGNQFNGNLRFNQLSHVIVLDGQLYNKNGLAFQSSSDNFGVGSANNLGLSWSKGVEIGNLKIKGGLNGGATFLPNTIGLDGGGTNVNFTAGAGLFASYEGAFLGISKPALVGTKNTFLDSGKPLFINVGHMSTNEDNFVTYNVNFLFAKVDDLYNYDFNLKLWFNKRMALGGSYRINNIYQGLYTKKNTIIPSLEYQFTEDLALGLAYNSNSLRLSSGQPSNMASGMNGIFQFYIRYNKANKAGDSWYYNQF